MKSNILKKRIYIWTVLLASLTLGGMAMADVIDDGVDLSLSPEVSASSGTSLVVAKQQAKIALDYVNQPPMIPHNVTGYQVSLNTNACLRCHSVQASRTTGAARISPTHFIDADGKTLGKVAPRRYFCLQCHVPQTDAAPIVENTFQPVAGFGQ